MALKKPIKKINFESQAHILREIILEEDVYVTGEQVKRILKRFIYELHNKLLDGFVVSLIRMGNLEYKTAPAFQRSSKFLNDGIMEIPERKILKFKASSKAKHSIED